jgi:hypothetical protein
LIWDGDRVLILGAKRAVLWPKQKLTHGLRRPEPNDRFQAGRGGSAHDPLLTRLCQELTPFLAASNDGVKLKRELLSSNGYSMSAIADTGHRAIVGSEVYFAAD